MSQKNPPTLKPTQLITRYLQTHIALLRLEMQENLTKALIITFEILVLLLVVFFFYIFANITLALWLNTLFPQSYMGFGIVALLQLFIWALTWLFRGSIRAIFEKAMLKKLKELPEQNYNEDEEEDD